MLDDGPQRAGADVAGGPLDHPVGGRRRHGTSSLRTRTARRRPARPCAARWRPGACGRRRPACRRARWRRPRRPPTSGSRRSTPRPRRPPPRSARTPRWRSGSGRDGWPTCRRSPAGWRARPPAGSRRGPGRPGRARRWRRSRRPGRGQHLDPGEVPEVAGVVADGVEVAVDPGVQRGGEVAGAEDERLEPIAGPGDLGRVGQPLGLLDEHLEPDPLAQAELGLELGQQDVDPPHVAGRAHLGHDEHVEGITGAGDDLDDVAVAPRRVEAVDADGPHRPAPVQAGQGADRDGPRRLLDQRRAGVLEVEEDEVGARRRPPSRTCARCWPAWPARNVGLGVRGTVASLVGSDDARPPAGRRAVRRRGRAGRRRRRRCRRRGPGRGGRSGPGVSLSCATGACTVIGPRSGSSTWTKVPRATRCSSASSCSAS